MCRSLNTSLQVTCRSHQAITVRACVSSVHVWQKPSPFVRVLAVYTCDYVCRGRKVRQARGAVCIVKRRRQAKIITKEPCVLYGATQEKQIAETKHRQQRLRRRT